MIKLFQKFAQVEGAKPSSRPQARNLSTPFLLLFAASCTKRRETVCAAYPATKHLKQSPRHDRGLSHPSHNPSRKFLRRFLQKATGVLGQSPKSRPQARNSLNGLSLVLSLAYCSKERTETVYSTFPTTQPPTLSPRRELPIPNPCSKLTPPPYLFMSHANLCNLYKNICENIYTLSKPTLDKTIIKW